jgi:hypothetical protein
MKTSQRIKFITALNSFIILLSSNSQVLSTAFTHNECEGHRISHTTRLKSALESNDLRDVALLAESVLKRTKKPTLEQCKHVAKFWNDFLEKNHEATAQDYRYAARANKRAKHHVTAAQLWDKAIGAMAPSKVKQKHYKKAASLWRKAIQSEGVDAPAAHYLRAATVCNNAGYENNARKYFAKGYMNQAWSLFNQGQYKLAAFYGNLSLKASSNPTMVDRQMVERFQLHSKTQNGTGLRRSERLH